MATASKPSPSSTCHQLAQLQQQQQQQQQSSSTHNKQHKQNKQMLLEEKTERLFGYSLSTPNLNMRQNVGSSPSPLPQQQKQQQHQQKCIRKIHEKHCLSVLMFEVDNSPQISSLLLHISTEEVGDNTENKMEHYQPMNDDNT